MPSRHGDRSRDREASPERRERRRHKSSKTKRRSSKERERDRDAAPLERSSAVADPQAASSSTRRKSSTTPVPELQRRAASNSPNGSRASLPYPSFSKAHSREAVASKENMASPLRKNLFTPDPTDLQREKEGAGRKDIDANEMQAGAAVNGPPSPPLTAEGVAAAPEVKTADDEEETQEHREDDELKDILGRKDKNKDKDKAEDPIARPSVRVSFSRNGPAPSSPALQEPKRSTSRTIPLPATVDDASSVTTQSRHLSPHAASPIKASLNAAVASTTNSEDTTITPTQPRMKHPFASEVDGEPSPPTGSDSSLKTPTPRATPFPNDGKQTPVYAVPVAGTPGFDQDDSPAPPPPPPPPPMMLQAPRVDYLMKNGGLQRPIPKQFLHVIEPSRPITFSVGELPNTTEMAMQVDRLFSPFKGMLEDFTKVMAKNGSIAVATGYRSIARRLLDRLEAVFARDISCETCACVMCDGPDDASQATQAGVSWGEILEYVSGRQELPPWPPFVLDGAMPQPVAAAGPFAPPMQKLDIDVPEEYREHYVQQSKKTKQSVDRWLASQQSGVADAPEEADDDTLTFAILTHLEPDRRPIFRELLGVPNSTRPPSVHPGATPSRMATPLNAPASDFLTCTSLAIRRLYRLLRPPRIPECAVYLLNNPILHNVLATVAAISDAEWDILVSGRFEGFLRSGADDHATATASPQSAYPLTPRGPSAPPTMMGAGSRNFSFGTPGSAPRAPHAPATPSPLASGHMQAPNGALPSGGAAGAPVALDEETELAALAEVEREIYLSMEVLEDAFEALHGRAEGVRRALRERAAGLAQAAQARRGSGAGVLEARLGTPAGVGVWEGSGESGTDEEDGWWGAGEIGPDDSASRVSRSRAKNRRPRRRHERRTPAPVEEEPSEVEESEEDGGERGPAAGGRTLWSRVSARKR